jgi:hypothetical protein
MHATLYSLCLQTHSHTLKLLLTVPPVTHKSWHNRSHVCSHYLLADKMLSVTAGTVSCKGEPHKAGQPMGAAENPI